MKMNLDCIRSVLLELEDLPLDIYAPDDLEKTLKKYDFEDVNYSLIKLEEAGYVRAQISRTLGGDVEVFSVSDITFSGHQFLEKIRDDQVWGKTKSVAASIGSWALDVVTQIATAVISDLINRRLSGQS